MRHVKRAGIATLAAAGLALAGTAGASAANDDYTHYHQVTGGLHCQSGVAGGNPGGKISAWVSGSETEPVGYNMRTALVQTYLIVQKRVGQQWLDYQDENITENDAVLGAVRNHGSTATAPWVYTERNGSHHPRLARTVDTSGHYRLVIESIPLNQDGLPLIPPTHNNGALVTVEGICSFAG